MAKKKNHSDLFPEDVKSNVLKQNDNQNFADMFETSMGSNAKKLKIGDKLNSEILSIGKEETFVATGTSIDAVVRNADLLDSEKEMKYGVGDKIDIVILRVSHDEIRATLKGSKSAPVDFDNLEDAFDMELPVEGKVTETVNGGYRVVVQGQPGFCPISQMDRRPVANPEDMIGMKFEFLITQFEPRQRNLVVSRRKLLDLQRAETEGLWIQEHKVGEILPGTVTRLEPYGAFVELEGGLEGLVHISEISFTRLKHASDILHLADKVQVKLMKIEEEETRLKIGLSIKEGGGASDPWLQIIQDYPVGTIFDGVVDKAMPYGVFVAVIPGVNGLLPKSKWRDAEDSKKYDALKTGEAVKLRVDEIRFEERKVSLGLPSDEDNSWREHQNSQAPSKGKLGGAFAAAFSKANTKVK